MLEIAKLQIFLSQKELMNMICAYNTQHNLDDIVHNMLNEAFLEKAANPIKFMAEHLLHLNGTNAEEYSKKLEKKLSTECSIYAALIEEKNEKKAKLKKMIELMEKQLEDEKTTPKEEQVQAAEVQKPIPDPIVLQISKVIYPIDPQVLKPSSSQVVSNLQEIVEASASSVPAKSNRNLPAPPQLAVVPHDIESAASSDDDTSRYDFVPPDIIRMYKKRNEANLKIQKEKQESEFAVVICPTLSVPAANGLHSVSIKQEKD